MPLRRCPANEPRSPVVSSKCVPGISISEQRYLESLAQNANRSQQAHAGGLSVCLGTNCLTSLVLSSEESSQFILLILLAPSASFSPAKRGHKAGEATKV